jgi:hypothetical protein
LKIPLTKPISVTVRPNRHRSMDFYYRARAAMRRVPAITSKLATRKNNV